MRQYENLYKQKSSQLEHLKLQFKSQEKELQTFKQQKAAITANHSNIVKWQTQIANLEMEKENLMMKNGVLLMQKNEYLIQLSESKESIEEMKMQMEALSTQIAQLEQERTATSANYTQQLSKKDEKYKGLKTEYTSLNSDYKILRQRNVSMEMEMKTMIVELTELKQEKLLMVDETVKMRGELERHKRAHQLLTTEIHQVKGDSTMAVRLAQKKDRNIIKDLRTTLKSETMKLQQLRAEYMQAKDEVYSQRFLEKQSIFSSNHGVFYFSNSSMI